MINGTIEQSGEWPVIRFERRLAISQERVWRAITDPAELRRWLAEVELSLVVGGKFELRFPFRSDEEPSAGSVTALEPGRMIEFTWFPAQLGDSRVRIELSPTEDGCLLVLTHRFPASYGIPETLGGWHVHLDALGLVLAGEEFELRDLPWAEALRLYAS